MQLFKQKTKVGKTTKYAPAEVKTLASQGKELIIVEKDFDEKFVPDGYVKLKLKSPVDEFIGLMPAKAIFYLDENNLFNGNIDDALDCLSGLYSEIEDANDVWGDGGRINAGGVDLAVTVRRNYQTLLTNKLLQGQDKEGEGEEVESAEYDAEEASRLCLDHDYVDKRMKAIAALATGKDVKEIRKMDLTDILGFKDEKTSETFNESSKLFRQVTEMRYIPHGDPHTKHMRCLGDSHYFLKDEFRDGKDGWDYDLRTMTRTRVDIKPEAKVEIKRLEEEIAEYQKKHTPGDINEHDANLTRMAANMRYGAKLDVNPVIKNG
jgi:hypothetical protein